MVAAWAAPRLELGDVGTLRLCVGPRLCRGRLVPAGGLAVAVAQAPDLTRRGWFWLLRWCWGSLVGGSARCRWRRRGCSHRRLRALVAGGGSGGWWLSCVDSRGGLPLAARGESLALALVGADDGDACERRTPSWRRRRSRAYGLFSRTPGETLVPGSWGGRWRHSGVAVLLGGIVLEWSWPVRAIGSGGARPRGRRGSRSGGSGSHRHGGVSALVTWVAVSLASLVRGLGVGVDVGAAAPDMVVGCRLRLLG
jgi:hypothetical protein